MGGEPHLAKGVRAQWSGEEPECQQQRERAEARHQNIDVAGAPILGIMMVREHERPRRQRHELPGDEKAEGIVGQQHSVHAGEEHRIERQHAAGPLLVAAIAERIEARSRGAEVDDGLEEQRQRVDTKTRADPRQPDRQRKRLGRSVVDEPRDGERGDEKANGEADRVDQGRRDRPPVDGDSQSSRSDENGNRP